MAAVDAQITPSKHQRFAALGAVLARATVADEIEATYALRVLRHQLRIMNTNNALKAPLRSERAQAVIDAHAAVGTAVPKNGSPDALHSDHVHPVTAEDLHRLLTIEDWLDAMPRLTEVVCLTAAENYSLLPHEAAGITGWDKYEAAGIVLRPVGTTAGGPQAATP